MRNINAVIILAILFTIMNNGKVVAQSTFSSNAAILIPSRKMDVFNSSPGLLKNIMENAKSQDIQNLSNIMIKGKMNFNDLRFLAKLPSILRLDLSEVQILGDAFHRDNSFPSDVFKECNSNIAELILPDGLMCIERLAFTGLSKLQKIEIPDKCQIIGEGAFKNTTSLRAISLPDSLLVISDYAFYASGVRVISVPRNVKLIGKGAFQKSQLVYFSSEKVKACTILNDSLLADCGNLQFVCFHRNVKIVGKNVFANDLQLKRVEFKSLLPPYLLDKKKHILQEVEIKIPMSSAQLYKTKPLWRKLEENFVFTDNIVEIDIDRLQEIELARIDSSCLDLHLNIAEKQIINKVDPGVPQESLFVPGKPMSHTDSGMVKKECLALMESFVPKVVTTKMVNIDLLLKRFDSELRYRFDSSSQSPLVKQKDFPTKIYWLNGRLYVEASKVIKVANLMTLEGVYIYGKAEGDYIWSFKIEKSKVASVRISYDKINNPELIKMK